MFFDEGLEFRITLPVGLGQENVARALQVLDRLAEDAAREQIAVPEGIGLVHQQQIETPLQRQILKTIVQHEGVTAKFLNRIRAGLHPVLVHEHDHSGEIPR